MKTLILGLDAFDPGIFERLYEAGEMPHLGKFVAPGKYARFEVASPPQSEVSWTSIATGLDPGGHGIFDFVHRDPATYRPIVSLLPTRKGRGGIQFVRPSTARTIFDQAASQGYPATSLWWPATFPARPESPVATIPGLGTPDLFGRWGVGTLFTSEADIPEKIGKTRAVALTARGKDRFTGIFPGPMRQTRQGAEETGLPLEVVRQNGERAHLKLGSAPLVLLLGEWSPILTVSFKAGMFFKIRAITRLILTQTEPHIRIYALPLQLHPLHPIWRYGTPRRFVKQTWEQAGPFLTVGWPQDTTGLEDGCINDEQFLALCDSIFEARRQALRFHLQHFREGVLGIVFDSLDRIQHMFLRDRPEVVEGWYRRMDALVGEVGEWLAASPGKPARWLALSDHGFTRFDYKVHLNRFLQERGYLQTNSPQSAGTLKDADWTRTRAYAIGLNSIYLNLRGREGRGKVAPEQKDALLGQLKDDLLAWRSPDGTPVIQRVLSSEEAFSGPLAALGPDLIIGYAPGFRASQATGTGEWESNPLETNTDHWGADHCVDSLVVPGTIFANEGLGGLPRPSYRDIPALAIDAEPDSSGAAPPPASGFGDEDESALEERLRSLGYL